MKKQVEFELEQERKRKYKIPSTELDQELPSQKGLNQDLEDEMQDLRKVKFEDSNQSEVPQ